MAHAASALAAINNGVAVTTLPTPDGDGAYVFGNASYTTGAFFCDNGTSCFAGGLAYPVWDYIGVPSGSTVKFVGGVALSSLPAGCSFDFSGCTHLFVTDESVFGFGFTVPDAMTVNFTPCTVTTNGSVATFSRSSGTATIDVPMAINGTNAVGKLASIVYNGAITGDAESHIILNGWDKWATFNGALDFAGKLQLGTSQLNVRAAVRSPEGESNIGCLEGHDYDNSKADGKHGLSPQLFYLPDSNVPSMLYIGSFDQHGLGGLRDPAFSGANEYRRWGVILNTCSNNTICVSNIVRNGAIHLMASSSGAYTFGNEPAFDGGFGNFEIVHLGKNAQGHADRAPTFYPSPNANLRFTGRFTGDNDSTAPSFNYTAESNVVNRGTLDTTTATVYESGKQQLTVTGYSPWNLPRTITTHPALTNRMTVVITDTHWLMPLDFAAAPDEIDIARCETDLKLSVPASGTVVVSNATVAAGVRPIPGRYPVITGNSVVNSDGATGADAFANWTVEQVGKWGGCIVELDKTDTGLWMAVKRSGMSINLR